MAPAAYCVTATSRCTRSCCSAVSKPNHAAASCRESLASMRIYPRKSRNVIFVTVGGCSSLYLCIQLNDNNANAAGYTLTINLEKRARKPAEGDTVAQDLPTQTSAVPGTFPALVLHHAKVRGARPAMREKDLGIWQTLTWSDVERQVRALANGLAALGVRPGEHVAVVGENRPRLYLSMMAAQAIGAIPVPLYQDAVAQEMLYVLQDAEIRICVVENQEQVDKIGRAHV